MPVYTRGNGYQAAFQLKGWPRVREQFASREAAEAYELECRAAHRLGKPRPLPVRSAGEARAGTIGGLVEYCYKLRWASKKSGASLVHNARLFAAWVGPETPVSLALTPARVDDYVAYRQDAKRNSSATVNRHLSAVSVLIEQAARLGHIPARFELAWQKEGRGRLRWYTEREEAEILDTLRQWGRDDLADLFVVLVDTGGRLGEVLALTWADIRGRSITFDGTVTKNGETRTVTATPRVMDALDRRRAVSLGGPFATVTKEAVRGIWERLRERLPWMDEHTVVHTFRHTCASRLVQRGVDLYRVKTWMGHKDLSTTMRYAHLAPRQLSELADVLAGGAAQAPG